MASRALRRAQLARAKKRIKDQVRFEQTWMLTDLTPPEIEAYLTRQAGLRANTRTLCSCWMCRSERKFHGNGRMGLTMQERRLHDRADDQEHE